MVKRCAWGIFNCDSRYKENKCIKDVTWWPIIKQKTRLRENLQWVKACNRKHFTVKKVDKHAVACGKHFLEGRHTATYPVLLIVGSPSKTQSKPTRRIPLRKTATQLHRIIQSLLRVQMQILKAYPVPQHLILQNTLTLRTMIPMQMKVRK